MQIPIFTVPGLHYDYYAGIAVDVMRGHVARPFALALGANASIWLGPSITGFVYGMNLFACGAAVYLLLRRRMYGRFAKLAPGAPDASRLIG